MDLICDDDVIKLRAAGQCDEMIRWSTEDEKFVDMQNSKPPSSTLMCFRNLIKIQKHHEGKSDEQIEIISAEK